MAEENKGKKSNNKQYVVNPELKRAEYVVGGEEDEGRFVSGQTYSSEDLGSHGDAEVNGQKLFVEKGGDS